MLWSNYDACICVVRPLLIVQPRTTVLMIEHVAAAWRASPQLAVGGARRGWNARRCLKYCDEDR